MPAATPFAKTGERRSAPTREVQKAADHHLSEREVKLAELEARAAAANQSTMQGPDVDGTGHVDVNEMATALLEEKRRSSLAVRKKSGKTSTKSTFTSTGGRSYRPAVPPPAKAVPEIPRYYQTTTGTSFRQYTVKEMVDAAPSRDRRNDEGGHADEIEVRKDLHPEDPN
mmetsp:Transcript_15906/g.46414  ORF Transcript_15906/g.46414 Transcript_15906/m.46414 type:complete len:170 (-) Transcript_15906:397-906(-)